MLVLTRNVSATERRRTRRSEFRDFSDAITRGRVRFLRSADFAGYLA